MAADQRGHGRRLAGEGHVVQPDRGGVLRRGARLDLRDAFQVGAMGASLGCATPINAERFSTNGPNRGKSVWLRARAVFEEQVWPDLRKQLLAKQKAGALDPSLKLPAKPGPAPKPFAETGPTYLWISADNGERGNMTACGSSGMSGAGGCS